MLAKGISFQIGNGGSPTEVFTQIPGVTVFTPSGTNWDTEETTSHDSADPIRTAKPTVRTDGSLSLVITWEAGNTQHELIRSLSSTGALHNYKITYPNSSIGTFTFSGYVTLFQFDAAVDGLQKVNVTITPHGAISDVAARLVSVLVTDSQAGAYVTGEAITLSGVFDEIVKVSGTPRIPIVLDSGTVYATYASGTGTNVLTFSKTFGGGDQAEATEVSITSPVDLNSGTIKDMAGQAATLTFTPPNTAAFSVNPA